MPRRRRFDRRRAPLREVLGSLVLAIAMFASVLVLPFGRVHAEACRIVSTLSGRGNDMPCGLMALHVSINTDRSPFLSISVTPLKLPISL